MNNNPGKVAQTEPMKDNKQFDQAGEKKDKIGMDVSPGMSGTTGNRRAMSPHDRGVIGATARWQGQEAAEQIKQKLLQPEQPSSDSAATVGNRGGEKISLQERGRMGAEARWHGAKDGQEKMGTNSKDKEKPVVEQPGSGKDNMQKMSPQQRGHLGGMARWYGQDAAEEEREKIRKATQEGDGHKSPEPTGGEGNISKMSPQQRGHLGGMARWHGRESIEKELQDHRDKLAGRGVQ
ncbi:hypothetical protein AAVH_04090 [Aphelenchoides avenae]|nr:hypothetical protein AAVH_04090 [Aphelenchus avenae]